MGWPEQESKRRAARSVVIVLALLSLVYLLQVTPHGHANSQDELACLLCQAVHVSATPVVLSVVLIVLLVRVGEAPIPKVASTLESFFHHSDPRGPPTEVHL